MMAAMEGKTTKVVPLDPFFATGGTKRGMGNMHKVSQTKAA